VRAGMQAGVRARVRVRGPARERPPGIRSIGCARARGGSRVSVTDYPLSNEHVSSQVHSAVHKSLTLLLVYE